MKDDWAAVDRFWDAKPNRKGYFEALYPDFRVNWDRRAEQEAKIEAATEVCRDIAKPVPHRYRIFLESRDAPEIPLSEMERKGPTPVAFPFESTVVVQGAQSTSAAAVEALNAIVRKATGRTFEVRTTGGLADCADKRKIYVGRGPELDEILVGWWIEKTYGTGESLVMLVNGDLFIFGKDDQGSLMAVYDFCEDSLGYRGSRCGKSGAAEGTVPKTDVVRFNGVKSRYEHPTGKGE